MICRTALPENTENTAVRRYVPMRALKKKGSFYGRKEEQLDKNAVCVCRRREEKTCTFGRAVCIQRHALTCAVLLYVRHYLPICFGNGDDRQHSCILSRGACRICCEDTLLYPFYRNVAQYGIEYS